jgi:hypothetical protein
MHITFLLFLPFVPESSARVSVAFSTAFEVARFKPDILEWFVYFKARMMESFFDMFGLLYGI